jgi:PmbA protein
MRDKLAEIAHQVLDELPPSVQSAHVIVSFGESTPVNFEADKLKSIKSSRAINLALRVIVDGRRGSATVTSPDDIAVLIDNALSSAKFGRQVNYVFPEPQSPPQVEVFDEDVARITTQQMVERCQEMICMLKDYNPDITTYAGASKSVSRFHMANTSGLDYGGISSSYGIGIHGELVRGEDILYAGYGFGWRKAQIDHTEVARKAIERFRLAEQNVKINSGRYPVLFPPTGLWTLLLTLRLALSGKNALMGDSPLSDKLGGQIFNPSLSITDSALVDYMSGSGAYDSDGVRKGETKLVETGVLEGFLYDLDTASRAGKEPTGNDGCSPNNWIISPGQTPLKEILAGIKEGLMVENVMGLGQGNPISGEFSVNVALGYKIENGEIVGRVKNTMLAGNVYDALKEEIVLSSDREWVGGWLYAPAILVPELNVVSK